MLDFIFVTLYLLVMIVLGIRTGLNIKDFNDYAVGQKKFPDMVITVALFATVVGGGSTLGFSEKIFSQGLVFYFTTIGMFLGDLIIAFIVIPRLGQFSNCISVGDIMAKFYGPTGKLLTGIAGVMHSTISLGLQASALGFLTNYFLGWPHWLGAVVGMGSVVVYSCFGGIRSVTITDVVQFGILIIAIPAMCSVCLDHIGGLPAIFSAVPAEKLNLLPDSSESIRIYSLIFVYMAPMLSPQLMQRFLITKDTAQAKRSFLIYSGLRIPFYLMVTLLGLCALVLNPDLNSNLAFPYLVDTILPVGIKSLVIIGMLAAIMSTADSMLHLSGLMLTHDVIRPLSRGMLTSKNELRVAQIVTGLLGMLSIVAAISVKNLIELNILSYVSWAPLVSIPMLAAILGYQVSVRSFLLCGLAGISCCLFWKYFVCIYLPVDALIPAMIVALIVFIVSYVSQTRSEKINAKAY